MLLGESFVTFSILVSKKLMSLVSIKWTRLFSLVTENPIDKLFTIIPSEDCRVRALLTPNIHLEY